MGLGPALGDGGVIAPVALGCVDDEAVGLEKGDELGDLLRFQAGAELVAGGSDESIGIGALRPQRQELVGGLVDLEVAMLNRVVNEPTGATVVGGSAAAQRQLGPQGRQRLGGGRAVACGRADHNPIHWRAALNGRRKR